MKEPRLGIRVARRAGRQIEEAAAWWRANRPAHPEALSDELARAFELISQHPGIGAPALSPRLAGTRRLLLRRVGCFLHYRVAPRKQEIHVVGFRHAHRAPLPPR